jgi:preprotein translocase subunit SecF
LDSSKTYTKSELRQIAFKLIEGKECCQLLQISEQSSLYKNKLIETQDSIIVFKTSLSDEQQKLITKFKENEIEFQKALKKQKVKTKLSNSLWASGLLILVGGAVGVFVTK